jgi:hypothetical protein
MEDSELYIIILLGSLFLIIIITCCCRSNQNRVEDYVANNPRGQHEYTINIMQVEENYRTIMNRVIEASNQSFQDELKRKFNELKIIKANEHPDYIKDLECCISLENISEDEEIYFIKCKHIIKKEILEEWLGKKWECPFCRETDLLLSD